MALGWGITNALTARNHAREANALETAMKVDGIITDRATEIVNRFMALTKKSAVQTDGRKEPLANADANAAEQERLRQHINFAEVGANGEGTIEFPGGLGEQPLDTTE